MAELFDRQVHRLTFVSAIFVFVAMGISFVLPLDHPDGFAASHGDRVVWLVDNRGAFILGWLNQIVAMVTLTCTLAGFAWKARAKSPMAALLASLVLFSSFIAFIVPKFIAVWSLPLLAEAAATAQDNSAMASTLLSLLNVSVPYSLFTAFDYLGFWLYAVFALLVARHIWGDSLWDKLASVSLGIFGVLYHIAVAGVLMGAVPVDAIEAYAISTTVLLLVAVVCALRIFRPSSVR